jgi:hypothetical protein
LPGAAEERVERASGSAARHLIAAHPRALRLQPLHPAYRAACLGVAQRKLALGDGGWHKLRRAIERLLTEATTLRRRHRLRRRRECGWRLGGRRHEGRAWLDAWLAGRLDGWLRWRC